MILDIIVALVVAFGFYTGYSNGLIKTILAAASILIGIAAALKLSPIMIGILDSLLSLNPALSFLIGFVLTFLLVLFIIRFIGNRMTELLKKIKINFINQILGGAFMALFFAVVMSYAVFGLSNLKLLSEEQQSASITYPMLEPLPKASKSALSFAQPIFSEFWHKMMQTMEDINGANQPQIDPTPQDENLQEG